jgi:prefoldin subunit 5
MSEESKARAAKAKVRAIRSLDEQIAALDRARKKFKDRLKPKSKPVEQSEKPPFWLRENKGE